MNILSAQGRISRGPFLLITLLPTLVMLLFMILPIIHLSTAMYINSEKESIRPVTFDESVSEGSVASLSVDLNADSDGINSSASVHISGPDKADITSPIAITPHETGNLSGFHAAIIAIVAAVSLLITWIIFAAEIKRLHDIGQTGLLVLLNFIPCAGFFLWLFLAFAKGQSGANKYGPDPKAK